MPRSGLESGERGGTKRVELNFGALKYPNTRTAYNLEVNSKFEVLQVLVEEQPPDEIMWS